METADTQPWHSFPAVVVPSPVLALVAGPDGLWAGGAGGVAWYTQGEAWAPRVSGLALSGVAALARAGPWLLAGGVEGIARSRDGGLTWQQAAVPAGASPVAAFVVSPRFTEDGTALAATLNGGIVRSDDAGRTWHEATFGLQELEALALAWGRGETVLAATADGIYRSTNAGRAWRVGVGSEGAAIAALAYRPDGTALAALEEGGLLASQDRGAHWSPYGQAPSAVRTTALLVMGGGELLLGTADHGLLRSTDDGLTWRRAHAGAVLSLATSAGEEMIYAGLSDGVVLSHDRGVTWTRLPTPPLHDLRQIVMVGGRPWLWGCTAGVVRYTTPHGWERVDGAPLPLTAIAVSGVPGGATTRAHDRHADASARALPPAEDQSGARALVASSPAGLTRSTDAGATWHVVLPGEHGYVAYITFRDDTMGWAGSADGTRLLRTRDGGVSWQRSATPFGARPLAALQALPDMVFAATYDSTQQSVTLWQSTDDGETWEQGAQAHTTWPLVATRGRPPLFTLGGTMFLRRADGRWEQIRVGTGGAPVRRVAGDGDVLFALTTEGIVRSTDGGVTWARDDEGLPVDQIMDIALDAGTLCVLLAGGHVLARGVGADAHTTQKEWTV